MSHYSISEVIYEMINLINPECDTRRKGKVVISKNDMKTII